MPTLLVRLVRRADGGAVLRCRRADGSVTWQTHLGTRGRLFPSHDLTHFAVEIELPGTVAVYGLIAAGWDIEDTTGRGARGSLPSDAVVVPRAFLDDDALARIRARRSELLARWRALPEGATLELGFGHSSPLSGASP